MTTEHYDAIVIGTGQGGYPLALTWAGAGRQVAVIERGPVGGSCVNVGCTPTKTMVASARVAHLAQRASDYGVQTGSIEIDLQKIRQRKRDIVADFNGGSQQRFDNTENLEPVYGEARFTGERTIEVALSDGGRRTLTADQVFVNTGLRPATPPVDGIESVEALDNASIMELGEVPEHLIVMGGGYVGLEFGQMFRRFGAGVTIFDRGERLLKREDADVSDEVAQILRDEGIDVRLGTQAERFAPTDEGGVAVTLAGPGGTETIRGTHLLNAAGRQPNTDMLDLDSAGIETDGHGFVQVNDRLETTAPGVYAIGDVKGGPAFTHISFDDFRILNQNLMDGGDASIEGRVVPYTVFIDPQLGRVGLSEREAREQGYNARVAKIPMEHVARALETDETRGFMKAVVDGDTDRILGAAILGIEGGEVMAVLQTAMMGELPYTIIRDGAFAHPTLAESLNNLFSAIE